MFQQIKYMQLETELTEYDAQSNSSPNSPKKEGTYKTFRADQKCKTILMIVFYICSFFQFDGWQSIIFVGIYVLMLINNRKNIIDLVFVMIALILSITNLCVEYNLLGISQIIMSLNILTYPFSQRMIKEIKLVWFEIKNLSITMFFILCLCAYSTTAYYDDDIELEMYYGTFGRSVLTFVQALSLDDWAQIGRESDDLFGYFILCIYILLMTYFYLNIMMGILIETLQFEKKGNHLDDPFNYEIHQQQILSELIKEQNLFDKCIIGNYYEFIVFIISFGGIFISILEHFDHGDSTSELVIELIDDGLYTIHFIILIIKKGPIYDLERENKIVMLLHFIAGPLSLIFSLFFLEIGCLLNLLKIATTPSIKGIFVGTIDMLPLLMPQFTELFGILMFIASILTSNYFAYTGLKQQEYFSSFWGSFYTLIQIMTLDDWGNIVEPMYSKHGFILPYIIIPAYIFLSNFIILNTLIALSCEYFVEVKYYSIEKDQSDVRCSQFVTINELKNYLPLNIPYVIFGQHEQLNSKIKSDTIIQIQYRNLLFTAQVTQQSDEL
ncbi:unnamed protein product [Paramecium sonneborni]|uniref:Ion transport domain-containing protein n=1 Tax=Paramecium sonneborni TaxID=65129 RepID=A0A8S1NM84_9CILI|nr:unnamed protein product [Paramecium sonneborni]